MATARARARERAETMQRLTAATTALADALGLEAPILPTHHRDAAHLPTVQLDVIAAFLESVAGAIGTAPAEPEPSAKSSGKPKAAAKQ